MVHTMVNPKNATVVPCCAARHPYLPKEPNQVWPYSQQQPAGHDYLRRLRRVHQTIGCTFRCVRISRSTPPPSPLSSSRTRPGECFWRCLQRPNGASERKRRAASKKWKLLPCVGWARFNLIHVPKQIRANKGVCAYPDAPVCRAHSDPAPSDTRSHSYYCSKYLLQISDSEPS